MSKSTSYRSNMTTTLSLGRCARKTCRTNSSRRSRPAGGRPASRSCPRASALPGSFSRIVASPMIRRFTAALVLQASAAFAVGPHVAFVRVLPAPHDLSPAKSIAVIYAIGDNQKITSFVENFVEYVDRSGTLRVENAVEDNQHLSAFDAAAIKRLRREHPADAYVGI